MLPRPTPSILIRELHAPKPRVGVNLQPHEMHWQILGPDGRVASESEQPVHNLVLDNAKELAATYRFSTLNAWAKVGTGSTAPNVSQTALVAQVAASNTVPAAESDSITRTAPGVYEVRRVRQFDSSAVGGRNLTEWGWSPVGGVGNLMSRELFRDAGGNPITLTLAADQSLRLIYKTRITVTPAPDAATPASITIANLGTFNGSFWLKTGDNGSGRGDLYTAEYAAIGQGSPSLGSGSGGIWIGGLGGNINATEPFIHVYRVGEFALPFAAYAPASKKRSTQTVTVGASSWIGTLWGVMLGLNPFGTGGSESHAGLVFNFGASFSKDNLHKLIIDPWDVVSWA